jgi:hypothetical protein
LHLPGPNYVDKEMVRDTINTWPDVDAVVGLGDYVEKTGSPEEYQVVRDYFSKLKKPFFPVTGNHDYIYEDKLNSKGDFVKASPEIRQAKLERFKNLFGLKDYYYSKQVGPYLLLFLSADGLYHAYLTEISDEEFQWLSTQLQTHKTTPTIIFFHGPLEGTMVGNNEVFKGSNRWNFMAQPHNDIRDLLLANPQVFLWVSGHNHLTPTNAAFNAPENWYEKQVYNLHNPDLKGSGYLSELDWGAKHHSTLWANTLDLYPDRVEIKTYDFTHKQWLIEHNRTIRPNSSKTVNP